MRAVCKASLMRASFMCSELLAEQRFEHLQNGAVALLESC